MAANRGEGCETRGQMECWKTLRSVSAYDTLVHTTDYVASTCTHDLHWLGVRRDYGLVSVFDYD
jgi:hypothetical protein